MPKRIRIPISGYASNEYGKAKISYIEFRKKITVCEDNQEFFEELLNAAFNAPVIAEVEFYYPDPLRAKAQLMKAGILKEKETKEE